MKVCNLLVGARGIDTVVTLTASNCRWLKAHGFDFVVRYIPSILPSELVYILDAGLAFLPVTYAKAWDGNAAVVALRKLNIPQKTTVFLDIEDTKMGSVQLAQTVKGWTNPILQAGYDPGGYVGAGVPFTSAELYALPIRKYWHSCSRVVDHNGEEAGPSCGWVMRQLHPPNIKLDNGLIVDIDVIEADYRGREILFTIA